MSEEAIYKLHRYPSGELEEFEQVQKLVRCKECKYKHQCHKAVEHTTHDITSVTIAYRPIDFCSYGERREP